MPEDPSSFSSTPIEPIQPTPPLRRRILFLSAPYLLIALILLAVEIGTRLLLPYLPVIEVFVQRPALRPDLAGTIDYSMFTGDPWLIWRLRPNVKEVIWEYTAVSTNAQGFRHPGDIGRKHRGATRIVCLGDSVTFGFRVPVAFPAYPKAWSHEEFSYPVIMEQRLRQANPGKEIDVIPMAVPAYTTWQGMNWLKRDIGSLKPDIVTTCFGWNDICVRIMSDQDAMPVDWQHVTVRWMLAHSQALTHLSRWRHVKNTKPNQPSPPMNIARVSPGDYIVNQLKMAWLARDHGAQPMFIAPVYGNSIEDWGEAIVMKKYRDLLRSTAQELDIPFLDVPQLSEQGFPANISLFGERIHPNAAGHRIMASELLKFMKEHQMLKSLNVPEG